MFISICGLEPSGAICMPAFLAKNFEACYSALYFPLIITLMLYCAFALWFSSVVRDFFMRQSSVGYKDPPTLIGAWIPFLGSGIELSKNSFAFLKKYHTYHGKVFQTKIGLNHVYFVKDEHFAASVVSRHPDIYSFHEAFSKITVRLFGMALTNQCQVESMHKWARKHLTGNNLSNLMNRFSSNVRNALYKKALCMQEFQVVNLFDFTNPLVFDTAIRAFFGEYDSSLERKNICQETIFFDDSFVQIASGLVPEFLMKQQRKAQHLVGNYLVTALQDHEMTDLARDLFSMLGSWKASNVAFLFAWALNANSLPTIFWMILFLLRDKEAYGQVMGQVYDVLKTETGWDVSTATEFPVLHADVISKMTLMKSFMWETLRLRSSVHINRELTKDTVVTLDGEQFLLRRGNMIMCTNSHHDPSVFPDPEALVADRFLEEKDHFDAKGKKIFLPVQAFGHGVSMCPGRHFALMEGPAMAVMMLACFDWEAVSPEASVPPPSYERFGFGCMPLHPDYMKDPSVFFRVRVKPQFVMEKRKQA